MDDLLASLRPLLEPAGIGALFALALTLGFRLLVLAIDAWRQVALERARTELERVKTEQVIASAVREQAGANAQLAGVWRDLRQELHEQGIVLRLLAQRHGVAQGYESDSEQ